MLINAEIDNLMRETFHTLVSESQFAEKHNTTTCAIVDSARGIEGTDYASDIDAHSAVFRFGEVIALFYALHKPSSPSYTSSRDSPRLCILILIAIANNADLPLLVCMLDDAWYLFTHPTQQMC